jgi:hypothetical protein
MYQDVVMRCVHSRSSSRVHVGVQTAHVHVGVQTAHVHVCMCPSPICPAGPT